MADAIVSTTLNPGAYHQQRTAAGVLGNARLSQPGYLPGTSPDPTVADPLDREPVLGFSPLDEAPMPGAPLSGVRARIDPLASPTDQSQPLADAPLEGQVANIDDATTDAGVELASFQAAQSVYRDISKYMNAIQGPRASIMDTVG